MSPVDIRPFQPANIDALYRICLLTGWLGLDAAAHDADPRLLGDFYAAPYVHQDPGLCLVATLDGEPAGYILGAADSTGFRTWTETHWFPALRALPHARSGRCDRPGGPRPESARGV